MTEQSEAGRGQPSQRGAHELLRMAHGQGLPDGVRALPGGHFAVDLRSRGITVEAKSITQALTLRDADDIVIRARIASKG